MKVNNDNKHDAVCENGEWPSYNALANISQKQVKRRTATVLTYSSNGGEY